MEIRFINCGAFENGELFKSVYLGLSAYRRQKTDSLKNPEDKLLSLGAGYLLDGYLKERGLSEGAAEYAFGANGKPRFKNYNGLYFNISHSGKIAACAFSDCEVGLDVQKVRPFRRELIKKICTPEEEKKIQNEEDFFRVWAVKESYIKYTGEGLSRSLKSVDTLNLPVEVFTYEQKGYVLACCSQLKTPPVLIDKSISQV